jgi:hypothetical protein
MAVAQSNNANPNAPGQDRVCLITFGSHDQASAGADADIISAKYLPRKAAESQADFDQGGAVRIFEYGEDTEQTCDRLGGRS